MNTISSPSPFSRYTREYRKINFESKYSLPQKSISRSNSSSTRIAYQPSRDYLSSNISNKFDDNFSKTKPHESKNLIRCSSAKIFKTETPHTTPSKIDSGCMPTSNESISLDLYKKMYEEKQMNNRELREQLKDLLRCISSLQARLNQDSTTQKNEGCIFLEKRLAEQEEKLKKLMELNSENQRLRKENHSLTRVINRLTAE